MYETQYSRHSFDRFNDDLCELILSHLPIGDCFRYQCVSKQWRYLFPMVLRGRRKLIISDWYLGANKDIFDEMIHEKSYPFVSYTVRICLLEYLLQMCAFIDDITIDECIELNETIINIISDNCKHLKSFTVIANIDLISNKCWTRFGEKCGHGLSSIYISDDCNYRIMNCLMPFMPNLTQVYCNYNTKLCDKNIVDTKQLATHVESNHQSCYYNIANTNFELFSEKYCQQLTKISFSFLQIKIDENLYLFDNPDCMSRFARFSNLQCIECNFYDIDGRDVDKCLKLIGKNCAHLRVLLITHLSANIFHNFNSNGYQSLEKLRIKSYRSGTETVQHFRNCVRLRHLTLDSVKLGEHQLKDIDVYLPELRSLKLRCFQFESSDNVAMILRHLSKLTQLKSLMIGLSYDCDLTSDSFCDFIANCLSIRKLTIRHNVKCIDRSLLLDFVQNNNRVIDVVIV